MFISLKDINPSRSTPYVNYALVFINAIVFLYELTLNHHGQEVLAQLYGTVPSHYAPLLAGKGLSEASALALITSMFLHGGPAHLLGNMLFLWIFGDNVEDNFGHIGYLFFYLFCGVVSGLTHIAFNLHSNVPAIGASGAISGVLGAYLLLYPHNRVLTLILIFVVPIPAFIILGYWFLLQFVAGITSFGAAATGGVAWWAHIGGFLTGLFITILVKKRK